MSRYTRPVYSKDAYEYWENCQKKAAEFANKHSSETEKCYEVNGLYIWCISRKYDACMKKENAYGVQVWTVENRKVTDGDCFINEWFNNADEANAFFKEMKQQCTM